jgi:hypothetical protein
MRCTGGVPATAAGREGTHNTASPAADDKVHKLEHRNKCSSQRGLQRCYPDREGMFRVKVWPSGFVNDAV